MKQRSQIRLLLACLLVLCLSSFASAQLPNLSQISDANESQAQTTTDGNNNNQNTNTRGGNTASQTGNNQPTQTASGTRSGSASASASASVTSGSATGSTTNLFPTGVVTTTSGGSAIAPSAANRLSGAPTLQGVGIPTMVVPFTANAPFMQKSSLPEGTVFIAVGAVLAFLGFCVIAWRALVAWSINRSVKRAAMASIMASETKNPGGWASNPFKPAGGFYHQAPGGSTLDLNDKSDRHTNRASRNPIPPSNGSGLFFSPTASNATTNIPMTGLAPANNRSSTFLPAGYYASPSSQLGSGNSQTTIGGTGQGSPSLQARRTSLNRPMSNMQLAPPSREGQRTSIARPNSNVGYGGHLNPQASASSLQVGTGHGEDLPGSRAPSAYLEDLFESHGNPAMGGQGQGQGQQGHGGR
ncbi:hypothetical protein BDZ85DRAFT_265671 [Elsinoe ampelina]|uniref:Uncharacterized protein n=1 Tax=Elsinoe ampelina TaxID=302913 RepID=A0A6A6G7S0_9PEZI|nr:hypothetical protein BDZ85DRAFT_265671 [Elsinoe ampelina]